MTDYLPQLMLAWSIQLTGALAPGPSVALIANTALSRGRVPAVRTAAGVACGSIVLAGATVLGVTALFAELGEVLAVIRMVGVVYLLWLALKAFRNAAHPPELRIVQELPGKPRRPALSGLMLQLSNPKAILFWLAIATIGHVGDVPFSAKILFVFVAFTISFAAHGGYGILLSVKTIRQAYARARRWIEGAFGCFFVFASYELATTKL